MHERDHGELYEKLIEQKAALTASAHSFDNGNLWESARLASTASIIIHDGKGRSRSKSLLTSLAIKENLLFVSSSKGFRMEFINPEAPAPSDVYPLATLIAIKMSQGYDGFIPLCAMPISTEWHRKLSFDEWYAEPVYRTDEGRELNRYGIISSLRDQDGGAHIDAILSNAEYVRLKRDACAQMRIHGKPVSNAHHATMRQIAWEIERSLIHI